MSIGDRIGRELAELLEPLIGDRIRAAYAARFGRCRRCDAPLGGESPSRICEPCHVDEVLAAAAPSASVEA